MRASDIVQHLARFLPLHVDDFTTNVSISSLTRSGTVATAVTLAPHGLVANASVCITGAKTPIAVSSLTRSGIVGAMVTLSDHDMTENAGFMVEISGAAEPEFNGVFQLHSVDNRRTIRFVMADAGPTVATGSPLLLSGSGYLSSYNGLVQVQTVPTPLSFTFTVPSTLFTPAAGTIKAKGLPRISAAIDLDRILSSYTKQLAGNAWAFVVLGDAVADKSRHEDTDATNNIQRGNYFNARLIQSIDIYVFMPTANELSGRIARDRCEELLAPICRCLLMAKFPSLVENSNNPLQLSGHGFQAYNSAYYVHRYAFEVVLQLGESDVFVPVDDVAFRDIDLAIGLDVGTEELTASIDLDEVPLP